MGAEYGILAEGLKASTGIADGEVSADAASTEVLLPLF